MTGDRDGMLALNMEGRDMAKAAVKRDEPTVNIGFRVKGDVAKILDDEAKRTGETRSDVARRLLLKGLGLTGLGTDQEDQLKKLEAQNELLRELLAEKVSK